MEDEDQIVTAAKKCRRKMYLKESSKKRNAVEKNFKHVSSGAHKIPNDRKES